MELLDGLLADAGLLNASASGREAVARHREHRAAAYAALVGPLLVPDDRLAEIGRVAGAEPIAVRVVVGGGAGGLLALSRRSVTGIRVVGAVSVLRDLDDLAGNAARVTAAAMGLDESVQVLVELPIAAGWLAAAELIEAAGLSAQVRADRSSAAFIEQLASLVEIDLPFSVAGLCHPPGGDPPSPPGAVSGSLAGLFRAVDALAESGDAGQAVRMLTEDDHLHPAATLRTLSGARIRRRLLSVDCPDPAAAVAELGAAVSESGPAGRPPDTPRR